MEHYDIVIIGAGQAGLPLGKALAKAGKRTALIERKHVGGSCVNFGCTPTKAAISSARIAHLARRGSEFGLRIPIVEVDFAAVIERTRRIVEAQRSGIERSLAGSDNPKLIRGQARLDGREGDRFRVVVSGDSILADQVVLDTGTRSTIPPIDGISDVPFIHAGNWLRTIELPRRVVMIGAGAIALEMAQFYRRLGSEVVVIEMLPQVAGSEDRDVAAALQKLLEREGIEFHLDAKIERVEAKDDGVVVRLANQTPFAGTHLFIATGRTPNTDDLGLDTVGVKTKRGIIEADERLATNVPGIWAAGDVRGGPMFTHTAWDDHRVLESQIAGDGSRTTERVVPYAIFTDPELGRVGMSETAARESGKDIGVVRFDVRRNAKSQEISETDGFIKLVADVKSGHLLGAALLCHEAAELVHVYIDLMNARAPISTVSEAVYIHPTLAEAAQSAAMMFR